MKHPLWTAAILVIYALACVYLLLTIFGEIPVLPWTFSRQMFDGAATMRV